MFCGMRVLLIRNFSLRALFEPIWLYRSRSRSDISLSMPVFFLLAVGKSRCSVYHRLSAEIHHLGLSSSPSYKHLHFFWTLPTIQGTYYQFWLWQNVVLTVGSSEQGRGKQQAWSNIIPTARTSLLWQPPLLWHSSPSTNCDCSEVLWGNIPRSGARYCGREVADTEHAN